MNYPVYRRKFGALLVKERTLNRDVMLNGGGDDDDHDDDISVI